MHRPPRRPAVSAIPTGAAPPSRFAPNQAVTLHNSLCQTLGECSYPPKQEVQFIMLDSRNVSCCGWQWGGGWGGGCVGVCGGGGGALRMRGRLVAGPGRVCGAVQLA